VIACLSTALALLVAVPAGYAYGRLRFRLRTHLAFYTLFTQMAPPIGLVIPYFLVLNRLRMLDSYVGLVTIYLTFTSPSTLADDRPKTCRRSWRRLAVDGASRLTTFLRIMVPQVRVASRSAILRSSIHGTVPTRSS
jgi:multiple sugar transport system permease protein